MMYRPWQPCDNIKPALKRGFWLAFSVTEIAVLFWSIYIERQNYTLSGLSTGYAVFLELLTKILILGIVAFFFFRCILSACILKRREEGRRWLIGISYFILSTVFSGVFFELFQYVGSRAHGDMSTVIQQALEYKVCSYQGWYSTVFYNIALQLFPVKYADHALVFVQLCILSYLVGYVVEYVYEAYGKRRAIFAYLVFCLPPVLYFSQFIMRQTWFAFSFVLLLTEIDRFVREGGRIIRLSIITALTGALRPEGIWLIPAVFILLVFIMKTGPKVPSSTHRCPQSVIFLGATVGLFLLLSLPQKDVNDYKAIPILNPLANMLASPDFRWVDEEKDRKAIQAVADVDQLKESADLWDIPIVRVEGAYNRSFSDKEYTEFLKTYFRLVVKNPLVFLQVRWKTAMITIESGKYSLNGLLADNGREVNLFTKIINVTYNSTLPLLLLSGLLLYKRDRRTLAFWLLVMGEFLVIFVLVTQASYMFHMLFYLGAWYAVVLSAGKSQRMNTSGRVAG